MEKNISCKKQCVLMIHPNISSEFIFSEIRKKNYIIFSVVTKIESTVIDKKLLKRISNHFFVGTDDPAIDLNPIKDIIDAHSLKVVSIINGLDASLYYTDYLQKHLLYMDINLDYSKIRLNKFQVNQSLARNSVDTIRSFEVGSIDDADHYKKEINKLNWPLIAKPSEDTAAMAKVQLIGNVNQLKTYLRETLSTKNVYYKDKVIKKVILQEYIDPSSYEEYIVDCATYHGKTHFIAICRTENSRFKGHLITRFYHPIKKEQFSEYQPLLDYMQSVISALRVSSSLTHNEIFWNRKTNDIKLIESNTRIAGDDLNILYQKVYGYDAVNYFLSLTQPEAQEKPTLLQTEFYGLLMELYNYTVDQYQHLNMVGIASFYKTVHMQHKTKLPENFFKNYSRIEHISASIMLVSNNPEEIEQDVKIIIDRERSGSLFVS